MDFRKSIYLLGFAFILMMGTNSCQEESEHTLPVIHMRYYSDNLDLADYKKAKLKIEEKGNDVFNEYGPKIKYRGNSSFNYTKKSYSLKFEESLELFGLKPGTHWKLNAEYIDKTFMRNKISYDLFRAFTQGNYAPNSEFVVLYENQKYHGIYTVTEAVDEHRLGLTLKDPGAVLFKEPPLHFAPSEHAARYSSFAEYSRRSKRYIDFSPKARKKLIAEAYYNQRYPNVQKKDRTNVVHEITEFLFNASDEEFAEKVFTDYFDQENVLDWHLLLLITNNGDGIKKNNYIYRKEEGEPFLYCPWDFDHSFGREGDGELIREDICDLTQHKLFARLLELNPNNYVKNLNAKFLTLKKKNILTVKNLHGMIEENAKKLRPEIEANEARWPLEAVKYLAGSDFEKEIQIMKDWIEDRLPRIEKYLKELKIATEEADATKKEAMLNDLIVPLPLHYPIPIGSAVEPYDNIEYTSAVQVDTLEW